MNWQATFHYDCNIWQSTLLPPPSDRATRNKPTCSLSFINCPKYLSFVIKLAWSLNSCEDISARFWSCLVFICIILNSWKYLLEGIVFWHNAASTSAILDAWSTLWIENSQTNKLTLTKISSHLDPYNSEWSHIVPYGPAWPFMNLYGRYGPLWFLGVPCSSAWYGPLWPCLALFGPVLFYKAIKPHLA